ncbi:MAG TPA: hypothetical protein VJZ27_14040 [Aggregatilineales bacterium]|nr:hypothetical protein [Aggregatilineales bacterium]
MEQMKEVPVLGSVLNVVDTYPRISAWIVLSAGIVGLLVYEARDVGLSAGNWAALIIASIIVAGLCIWIVSWEDEDETPQDAAVRVKSKTSEVPAVSVDKTPAESAAEASTEKEPEENSQSNDEDS